jgi:hypothetical protein
MNAESDQISISGRYNIIWLFGLTLLCAALMALATQWPKYAYMITCISLPWFIAMFARFGLGASDKNAIATALFASIITGSSLAGLNSYYHAFIKANTSFPDIRDWGLVLAAACLGAVVGIVASIFAVLFYRLCCMESKLRRKYLK